jgi:anti-sigma regulatory factor (Ser/Thr protein kinase)
LTCQVSDDGPDPASQDSKPDAAEPPWPAAHGRGLWLVGQVASQFTVDHGPAGTTVTAIFTAMKDPGHTGQHP